MDHESIYKYIQEERTRADEELIRKVRERFPAVSILEIAEYMRLPVDQIEKVLKNENKINAKGKSGRPVGLLNDPALEQAYWQLVGIDHTKTRKLTYGMAAAGLAAAGQSWSDLHRAAYGATPPLADVPVKIVEGLNNLDTDSLAWLRGIADFLSPESRFFAANPDKPDPLDTPTRRVLFVASRRSMQPVLRKTISNGKKVLADAHRRTTIATQELPAAAAALGISLYWVLGGGPAAVYLRSPDAESLLASYFFMSAASRSLFAACVDHERNK